MKKVLFLALTAVALSSLLGAKKCFETKALEDDWITQDLDFSRWSVINNSSDSTVDFAYTEDNDGSYLLDINKSQACFSGIEIDVESQIDEASLKGEGDAISFDFKLKNLVSLDSTNTLNLSFNFSDGETWNILATQSLTGIPSLYDTDEEAAVRLDFTCLPTDKVYTDIVSFIIGVDGSLSSSFYIYDFKLAFSTSSIARNVNVDTLNTIGQYGSTFGAYQYGGASGTNTKLTVITDELKSKEGDKSALELSIEGIASTSNRFYSSYFKLSAQAVAASLINPQSISFWIYNSKSFSGGLYFKINGTEIYNGLLEDESGTPLTFSRDLDYVGFRKYTLNLTSAQFKAAELEIGIWGADLDSKIYLSKFSFIDLRKETVGYKYIGAMNAFNYTNYTDGQSFNYDLVNYSEFSHNADQSALFISRNEYEVSYYTCVYLQKFGEVAEELKIKKPTLLSIWVNSQLETSEDTGVAFKIKLSDSTLKEIYPTNAERGLNFTGFKNMVFDISKINIFDIVEFEFAIWGKEAASIYFSDINIYDGANIVPEATSYEELTVKNEDIIPLASSINAYMYSNNGKIEFSTYRQDLSGKTWVERKLDDVMKNNISGINLVVSCLTPFDHNVVNFELVYEDESELEASYIVASTSFSEEGGGNFIVNFAELPYFLNATNITKLRVSCFGEDSEVSVTINELKVIYNETYSANEIYSKVICDFDDESSILDWGISGEESSIYYKEFDGDARLGDGCLKYTFASMSEYNFSWSEIYYNLNDLVVKNSDKSIYGLSFWLYNTHYITSGAFGYWIKVSETNGCEYEVNFNSIETELDTNNNLAFTGWQKINIPLSGDCYTECSYNEGYSKDNPRIFDWKKLQYIKFGFWGKYFNAADGYSAIAKVDDFRFVSGEKIIDESETYNINYVLNGGGLPKNSKTTYVEGETFELPIPTRAGFNFEGWYKSASLIGNPIDSIKSTDKGNITLYAAWSIDKGYGSRLALIIGLSAGGALILGGGITFVVIYLKKKKKLVQ
ncbi:MAG: InlB B-repeat-containing protein [Bacilli bacterium]|nr:InlB B-repeat-containing protein [Bacilli bacterium]